MSYDAPGVPFSRTMFDFTAGCFVDDLQAFNFGLIATPRTKTGLFVLVFSCGCTRVIDRAGDFHEYPHAWVHTHFLNR